ncbi:MAG: hypothetical protein BEN18_10210 [Epulopiscium sp. Nuni2H_MBin001]|nr:MAG: hypothetical protein BEN18_10210 [Epulopiscium sp. Nuni2H_MBin001]
MSNFSRNLNRLLKENNLTQKQLASRTDLTGAIISKYMSGKSEPSANSLQKIANCLNVPMEALLSTPMDGLLASNIPPISDIDYNQLLSMPDIDYKHLMAKTRSLSKPAQKVIIDLVNYLYNIDKSR